MTPEMRAAVFALPADERLKLAEELWDSVPEDEVPPLTEAQIAELDRRWEYLQAHPESGLTWEQVEEHIRNRHGR
jgi:putative addiction module component (TIGR02574 family)